MRGIFDVLIEVAVFSRSHMRVMAFLPGGVAAIVLGLMVVSKPGEYAALPIVLAITGGLCLLMLLVGLLASASEIAGGSQGMGGRTGVMLKDLEEMPAEDPKRKKRPTVRRQGDTVPDWNVRANVAAADAILEFLAEKDDAFEQARLFKRIEDTVAQVRAAVESGELKAVSSRMTAECRRALEAAGDASLGFDQVTVAEVRIIIVDIPADQDENRITALVTLHLLHKKKNELAILQEFWTFRRDSSKWKADRIRQAEEADDVCALLSQLSRKRYERFRRTASAQVMAEAEAYSE